MNAIRIRKKLEKAIPQLPELTPLLGRAVEIIVLEDSEAERASGSASSSQSTDGAPPPARFEDLLGGWPEDQIDDGFEQSVAELRRGPWRREID